MKKNKFYPTLSEAQQAVKRLGIISAKDYLKRYKEDPRLPSSPKNFYFDEWPTKNGKGLFLGKELKSLYPTFSDAQKAVTKLGISSFAEYKERYKEDPRLPSNPNRTYAEEWPIKNGVILFLGKELKNFYPTLSDTLKAVKKLGITSFTEYKKRYKEDPRLPSNPTRIYAEEWPNENREGVFLGKELKTFYLTFYDAQKAVKKLGITSFTEYKKRYKEDPHLPSQPNIMYSEEWPTKYGWGFFLGKELINFYPTFSDAQKAVKKLGISSSTEYKKRYKEDPRLPPYPKRFYLEEWPAKYGWGIFLGKELKSFYPTFSDAQKAVKKLGIYFSTEYQKRYKEDPRLPPNPKRFYLEEWPTKYGWVLFLGKELNSLYPTLSDAQQAAKRLGITSSTQYRKRYKEDPRLPFSPNQVYFNEWPTKDGWIFFLGEKTMAFYSTLSEAQQAVKRLNITSYAEYLKCYKGDPRLPFNPKRLYSEEWPTKNGWDFFLKKDYYPSLTDAKKAVIELGIVSLTVYFLRYKEDPRLPPSLSRYYSGDWGELSLGVDFFVPQKIDCFDLLLHAIKALSIRNSTEYRAARLKYKQLPSNPRRSFPIEFIDWYHLCDIPKPYSYEKLQGLVRSNNITTIKKYNKWRHARKDPCIPVSPHEHTLYKNYWVNWYVFFGIDEPFQPQYIHEPYLAWRDEINEFMRFAKGAGTKKTYLCKFIRLYIEKYQLGISPLDFVVNIIINRSNFCELLSQVSSPSSLYNAVDEFIDFFIREKCSDEDPDTGEVIRMQGAKNRLKGIMLPEEELKPTPDETVKPALSYQYVQAIRNWTIPSDAKTFSDLTHLHKFDADWVKVPIAAIDKNDADCVFEAIDDKFAKIWLPIYWMHTYTLFSIPLRGIQIAYNDSGEADEYIPEYKDNKVVWVKNTGKLAGLTDKQGMIKRYPNDEFGMFSTSNKTSINTGSQSVPWMPLELAYWLIKLRKWQSKYNPINAPKAWLECERTNLNEIQRKQKGINCFLFRDFSEEECGTFTGRLANRLAAALYFIQGEGAPLAICKGNHSALSHYKSKFTPHSMRVSLITIYVMEYNLDLSIIMKIAGHSSIVMSVYYVKTQGVVLRKKVEEGEKRALKSQADATQSMIEQLRIDEIKANLVGNSEETLNALNNSVPAGNYLFRDWGICPHAGTRCEDGGGFIGNTQARSPVPTGYLGGENCIRCRHFITGPAFIGGLLAIFQEIILSLEATQLHYDELIEDENIFLVSLEKENENEYVCNKNNEIFDKKNRLKILGRLSKTKSEYEVVAKKMDMLYCDLGAVSTLIHQCQALLNQSNLSINDDETNLQLIVRPNHELQVIAEEVSRYELLSEVCENAEIYQSASADLAITPRTQLLDNMMLRNNLKPLLFTLTNKQQLKAGNQLNKLFKERLKSHVKINDLIDGKLLLSDLQEHERIEPVDLLNVLHQQQIDIKEI